MAMSHEAHVSRGARQVYDALRQGMSHVSIVSDDWFSDGRSGMSVGVLLYEQYFMRVGNDVALMLLVSGDETSSRVKAVACAAAKDFVFRMDFGAAGAFAAEPMEILSSAFPGEVRVRTLES